MLSTGHVLVVGSINQDIVLRVADLPRPGETVLALESKTLAGGKGSNQAIAAARAGAKTSFVGALGSDAASDALHRALADADVDLANIMWSTRESGRAVVMVDAQGENSIIVDSGANIELSAAHISSVIAGARSQDVVIVQCEISEESIEAAIATGARAGATVVLNLAPYRPLSVGALRGVSVLVVNEGEAIALAGPGLADSAAALAERISRTLRCSVVITLGRRGSVIADHGTVNCIPASVVETVVDTTGAGDAFVGTLGARLAAGDGLLDAVRVATVAAAGVIQHVGSHVESVLSDSESSVRDAPSPRPISQSNTQRQGGSNEVHDTSDDTYDIHASVELDELQGRER